MSGVARPGSQAPGRAETASAGIAGRADSRPTAPHPSRPRLLSRLLLIVVFSAALTAAAPSRAQSVEPSALVTDLVSSDFRRAREAEDQLLVMAPERVVPLLLERRKALKLESGRGLERLDRVLEALVETLIEDATRSLSIDGYSAPLAFGGPGATQIWHEISNPAGAAGAADDVAVTPAEQRRKSLNARARIEALGPGVLELLLKVPPLRSYEARRVLTWLAHRIARQAVNEIADLVAVKPERARAELDSHGRNAELMGYFMRLGSRDERPAVRTVFQGWRDAVLESALAAIAAPEWPTRQAAERTLFRLPTLALPRLETLTSDASQPSALRESAAALAHRIRYGITPELYERLGTDLRDYARRSFRERRAACLEIERLGGSDGVPALRALLKLEPSDEVRLIIALGLARLGDPVGLAQLRREGLANSVSIPKADRIAIFMDQGIRYLNIRRFTKAEREFRRVLELEPKNDTALYNLACTYALWGRIKEALDCLEKAVAGGFDDVGHIESDPDLDAVRGEPRYRSLVAELKRRAKEDE